MKLEIARRLRERGYRVTPQRLQMLEVLHSEVDHLSAEEIHSRVAGTNPDLNLSTVYRTLEMLTAEGIVRQANLGGGRRFFELASETEPHHHLVCKRCGRIEHIAARHLSDLESHLLAEHGFEVDEASLTSYGKCRECRGTRAKK